VNQRFRHEATLNRVHIAFVGCGNIACSHLDARAAITTPRADFYV
jgi:hypothetical protein